MLLLSYIMMILLYYTCRESTYNTYTNIRIVFKMYLAIVTMPGDSVIIYQKNASIISKNFF